MTMLLENRTISMILTVPEVKEPITATSYSVENLEQTSLAASKNQNPSVMPIYHGSIIRIEQHNDSDNTSDLIVRVPNFHHSSLPALNITNFSSHDIQSVDFRSQRQARPKRRAPLCPLLTELQHRFPSVNRNKNPTVTSPNRSQSEVRSRFINTKRLTVGLRNLSRTLITSSKSKQSSANIQTTKFVPSLPDIEVITENLQRPIITKKAPKRENVTSKFLTPKLLFNKRKHFKTKKQQIESKTIGIEGLNKHSTIEVSSSNTNSKIVEQEQGNETQPITMANTIEITVEEESKFETIEKLLPGIPIIVTDRESTPAHCYYTIPRSPSDPHTAITDDTISSIDLPKSRFQSSISISKEKNDSLNIVESFIQMQDIHIHDYNDNIEDIIHVVHPNGDTYSEHYEITYELDSEYRNHFHHETDQIYVRENQDQDTIETNIDLSKYEELSKVVATWVPRTTHDTSSHNYDEVVEKIIDDPFKAPNEIMNINSLEILPPSSELIISNIARVKFHSFGDHSPISYDQSPIYQPEPLSDVSSVPENDQMTYFDDPSLVTEDYTVILQLLRHVLQIDTNTHDGDDDDDDNNNNIHFDEDTQKQTVSPLDQN